MKLGKSEECASGSFHYDDNLIYKNRSEPRSLVFLGAIIVPISDTTEVSVENISRSGFRALSSILLTVGQIVIASFDDHFHYSGIIRWIDGCRFGVEFETVFNFVREKGQQQITESGNHPPRDPRISTNLRARLGRIEPPAAGRIRNISPSGMMIETGLDLTPGQQIFVKFSDSTMVAGVVRWAENCQLGVQLANRVSPSKFIFGEAN
jgi:hypothetical protein